MKIDYLKPAGGYKTDLGKYGLIFFLGLAMFSIADYFPQPLPVLAIVLGIFLLIYSVIKMVIYLFKKKDINVEK